MTFHRAQGKEEPSLVEWIVNGRQPGVAGGPYTVRETVSVRGPPIGT